MIKKLNSDAAGAADAAGTEGTEIAINKAGKAKVYTAIVYLVTGLIAGVGYLLLSCVPEPPPSADPPGDGDPVKNEATAPGAPQNLMLSATKMGEIVAKWDAPDVANAKKKTGEPLTVAEVSYAVYYLEKPSSGTKTAAEVKTEATSAEPAQTLEAGKGVLTATISGLASGTIYYVVVEAINSTDPTKRGLMENPGTYMTAILPAAAAPTNAPVITAQVEAEKADTQIVVHWNAISADGAKKQDGTAAAVADLEVAVYYSSTNPNNNVAAVITGTPAKTVAATGTSATITGLAGGSTYYVALRLQVKDDVTKYRDGTSVVQYITTGIAPYPLFDAWSSSGNVVLYTSEAAVGALGPAIRDAILADATPIATVTALDTGRNFIYTLGSSTGTIAADGAGKLVITKNHVKTTDASDGVQLTLNKEGGDASTAKIVAVYRPTQLFVWQDVQAMRGNLAAHYSVQKDIVFPALSADGFPAAGFAPIGNTTTKFTGTLDGNGKTITGLAIQIPTTDYVGLFGYIEAVSAATEAVKSLTLHNPSVAGKNDVGVLVGRLGRGTVRNIAVTVDASQKNSKRVTGQTRVGGVVGIVLSEGAVQGYSQIDVEASGTYVGGLVGYNTGNATGYTTGQVSGVSNIGGLAGYSNSTVTGYTLGGVSGATSVGGLVGYNNGTVIGYARGVMTRSSGTDNSISSVVGTVGGNVTLYYSGRGGRYNVVDANGYPITPGNTLGSAVTVGAATAQSSFTNLAFGAAVGQWTWVGNGKWPALNLGSSVGAAAPANQPVDPYLSASTVAAPSFGTVTPTATSIPLTWGALSPPTDAKQANGAALALANDVAIELYYYASTAASETAAKIITDGSAPGILKGDATSATLTGLASGTKYHVLLRVVNKSDVSKISDVIKVYTTQ